MAEGTLAIQQRSPVGGLLDCETNRGSGIRWNTQGSTSMSSNEVEEDPDSQQEKKACFFLPG